MAPPSSNWSRWVPLLYMLFGILWIVTSDQMIAWLFRNSPHSVLIAGTIKGFAFVVLTALVLAVWARIEQKRAATLLRVAETRALQSQRELQENRNLLKALTDASSTLIYVFDCEGRAMLMNETCARVFGANREDLIGRRREEMMSEDDAEAHRTTDIEVIISGETLVTEEVLHQSAHMITFLSVKFPLRDLNDRIYAVGGISTDISELRETQRQLADSNTRLERIVTERTRELVAARDRAEESDRTKTAFLSTVSHELRTPLNSIIGFSDVLLHGLSGPLAPDQTRQLEIIRESADLLLKLINEILDVSRIEAGRLQLHFETFDLAALLQRRTEAVRPAAAGKGLEMRCSLEDGVGAIRSDPKRVAQIVSNLLSNAIKFTDAGSVTLVASADQARSIHIEVVDTGRGISAEDIDLIFMPFVQLPTGASRYSEGTGLGLAISLHLARALGGNIDVVSEPGRGTRFILTLPRDPPEATEVSSTGLFRRIAPILVRDAPAAAPARAVR
jgi:PAS domain S-box-containing protein